MTDIKKRHKKERPKKFWHNKDNVLEAARKCSTITQFIKTYSAAYKSAKDNHWVEELSAHMEKYHVTHWNEETILLEALKHNSISEIQKNGRGCYIAIRKFGMIDIVKSLYHTYGNRMHRCIYAYEFSDNHVYVGLTYNLSERNRARFRNENDAVKLHMEETGLIPELKQLTDYIPLESAIEKESSYLISYKDNGWISLNRVATGSVGGDHIRWDYESCMNEAKKYKTKIDMLRGSNPAYKAIKRYGWMEDAFGHMIQKKKPRGYWSIKENCLKAASTCKNRKEFENNFSQACKVSRDNNWLNEFLPI